MTCIRCLVPTKWPVNRSDKTIAPRAKMLLLLLILPLIRTRCSGLMDTERNRGVQRHPRRRKMRHGNPGGAKIRKLKEQNVVDVYM